MKDTDRDLVLRRNIAASPAQIWKAWTTPRYLRQWFTPAPVKTVEAVIDPVPGGRFYTVMEMPDGTRQASEGCILLAEPHSRLVFTDGLTEGFRPTDGAFMTASIVLRPARGGTLYSAHVLHKSTKDRDAHDAMGFEEGWGKALSQLEALAQTIRN
ncbi:SRPBCC family protein [Pseudaestuariivita atlantica]|uniref:Polyketide cyclase n=1 Tax=Pseudaestuariivita atlantica TaxID=1317121 RepID=A0A0L1JP66_9RHOB|nr:SRPBCC family protein [Pseudaestuariivita atlantica]KNG93502.1 polyketide cyclase [Pseudaestuariivita atlantica]